MKRSGPDASAPSPTAGLATGGLETRWRFEAPDLATVERWVRADARAEAFAITESAPRRIHDRFLDAPDLPILRAGYALRIRKDAREVTAALVPLSAWPDAPAKHASPGTRPSAGGSRTLVQKMESGQLTALFGEEGPVSDRLSSLGLTGKLRTLLDIRTQRQVLRLGGLPGVGGSRPELSRSGDAIPGAPPSSVPCAEGAIDPAPADGPTSLAVEFVLDSSFVTDQLGRTHRLSRVDLIFAAGSEESARNLADALRRECDLRDTTGSKLDWAMRRCGIQADRTMSFGRASVDPLMSVGQVTDAVLRKQCASFLWHEPGTRLGEDPEHLHDMRVASRRMRAALRLFRGALPPGEADRLRLQLREVAQVLGAVRDLDVFMIQLGELSEKLVGADAEACAPLLRHLSRSREQARQEMMKLLDDSAFAALKRALVSRMQAGAVHESAEAAQSVLTAGPVLIRQCRRRVLRSGHGLRAESPADHYHELRIRGKRLRYALEFLEGVYGPLARNLIDVLVELQDQLGLMQDARVSVQSLRAIVDGKPDGFTGETWVALGELIQIYEARGAELRHGIPRLLRRLEGKRWRALRRGMKELAVAEEKKHSHETTEADGERSVAKKNRGGEDPPSGEPEDPGIETDDPDENDPTETETRSPRNSC